MSFDLGSLLLGVGVASGIAFFLDKGAKVGASADVSSADSGNVAELQAEIDAARESQDKVDEVHAYARKLEEKIQQLESTSDSADAQLRVKVLEKQLSVMADLESRLAIALQELEDYRAKAVTFDEVGSPEEPVVALPGPEPVAPEVQNEPEVEKESKSQENAENDPLAAVAFAGAQPEITVVENEISIGVASPVGATAVAVEERPALRIESNPSADFKDPLEKIDGVGQVYQIKLYEAGIKTFAQLAAASPSRITEIVEPQNWQTIDIMKWRREAALYAAGEKF